MKIRFKICFCLLVFIFLTGCSVTELEVKEEVVIVEYGNEISVSAEDYLLNSEDVLAEVEVSSDIKNEEGKTYPAVGEYELDFTYGEEKIKVDVVVADTTAPTFINFKDKIETYQNSKVDFSSMYMAEDLSDVTITYDDSKVDYTTGGTYTATVTATDGFGNAETREATITVVPVTVQVDKTSASVYKGETVQLAATTNVPEVKATFTSSDDTIATVDENGLVTGVKTGKAVITAEANGVKAKCEVTVSEKSNTSKPADTTNTKPSTNTTTSKPTTNTGTTNKNPDKNTASSGSTNTGTNNGSTNNNSGNNTGNNSSNSEGNQFENIVQETPTPQTSKEAFDLINEERIKLGLEPAVWDAECERIALIRGAELAALDRVTEENAHEGFWKFQNENRKLCECVAWGCGNAGAAVALWMHSPGHKDIIMDPKYTKLAVVQVDGRWVAVNSR